MLIARALSHFLAATLVTAFCAALLAAPIRSAAQGLATGTVAPRLDPTGLDRLIDRISSESDAVIAAARTGGAAAIRRALEECWSAGAGYGIEALGPCVTREKAALALAVKLENRIGPLNEPALTIAASEDRIAAAYASRKAQPQAFKATPLLLYAVGRRVEPKWADAPTLREMTAAARKAAWRRWERDAEAATSCWIGLAVSKDGGRKDAWRCWMEAWAANDDGSGGGRLADKRREMLFFERARADRTLVERAEAAMLWIRAALGAKAADAEVEAEAEAEAAD